MSLALSPDRFSAVASDRVVLVGGAPATLDLLRLATIRSDDVVLLGSAVDAAARDYARRFAIEHIDRPADPSDLYAAASVLVALDDIEDANRVVRAARRGAVPIHVNGRPLVSDFTLLEFLERRPSARAGRGSP